MLFPLLLHARAAAVSGLSLARAYADLDELDSVLGYFGPLRWACKKAIGPTRLGKAAVEYESDKSIRRIDKSLALRRPAWTRWSAGDYSPRSSK
jgi:hypothetical protein